MEIVVEFPISGTSETHALPTYPDRYTLAMRGNTVVDISPRPERPAIVKMGSGDGQVFETPPGYPIYLREELKADRAPMKTVER